MSGAPQTERQYGRRVSDVGGMPKPGASSIEALVDRLAQYFSAPVYIAREGEPVPFSSYVSVNLGEGTELLIGKMQLTERESGYLDTVLPFAESAIAGHLAYEDKSIQALKDPLTGLLNRQGANEFIFGYELKRLKTLEEEVALRNSVVKTGETHDGAGPGLALILLDIDHFRKYNNKFGHQMGDRALQAVAQYAAEPLRKSDRAFRYGGEEIGLVLPHCSPFDAAEKAEIIRKNIEDKTRADTQRDPMDRLYLPASLTASFGVAGTSLVPASQRYNGPLELWTVLCEADRYLYASKRNGRNRVTRTFPLVKTSQ